MCDCRSTYLKKTILSSQFLGLKQGNYAKCMTFDTPISQEPYYLVNFLGWSRAVGQNVWLSIHLSQKNHIIKSISWAEAGQLGKMYDFRFTYFERTILSSQFLGLKQGNLGKMYDFRFTFFKRTILSSQFLGLKQGNWAKCVTFDSSISQEPYIIKSVSWVWLSIHLFQKNFIIKSISWVEPGQLVKMYDFRFTYFKRTIYFRVMFNTMYFHAPQLFITNVQIRRENYNIKSISWVEAGQ